MVENKFKLTPILKQKSELSKSDQDTEESKAESASNEADEPRELPIISINPAEQAIE